MDAGHFVPGRSDSLLFDIRGVHPQCRRCNRFLQGAWVEYEQWMRKKYGQRVIDELKAKKSQVKKYSIAELLALDKYWKDKLRELDNDAKRGT